MTPDAQFIAVLAVCFIISRRLAKSNATTLFLVPLFILYKWGDQAFLHAIIITIMVGSLDSVFTAVTGEGKGRRDP